MVDKRIEASGRSVHATLSQGQAARAKVAAEASTEKAKRKATVPNFEGRPPLKVPVYAVMWGETILRVRTLTLPRAWTRN